MARKSSKTLVMKNLGDQADNKSLNEQIAALAHALWLERGCPEGSPEEDWLTAEQHIKQRRKAEIVTLLHDVRRSGA
jgi:hypothetical protein